MTEKPSKLPSNDYEVPLVKRLLDLAADDNRAALSALRSGLGKPPGAAPRMYPIVAPFLTSNEGPSTEAAFLTAALFATHPENTSNRSLGASLWEATKRKSNPKGKHLESGVEDRFTAALDAAKEDLPRHLEGLVSLCESAKVAIDWRRFYWDVRTLLGDDESKQVRTRTTWARDFWRASSAPDIAQESKEESEN